MITFAEPDLMVLATQVKDFSTLESVWIFIATVSLGAGVVICFSLPVTQVRGISSFKNKEKSQ